MWCDTYAVDTHRRAPDDDDAAAVLRAATPLPTGSHRTARAPQPAAPRTASSGAITCDIRTVCLAAAAAVLDEEDDPTPAARAAARLVRADDAATAPWPPPFLMSGTEMTPLPAGLAGLARLAGVAGVAGLASARPPPHGGLRSPPSGGVPVAHAMASSPRLPGSVDLAPDREPSVPSARSSSASSPSARRRLAALADLLAAAAPPGARARRAQGMVLRMVALRAAIARRSASLRPLVAAMVAMCACARRASDSVRVMLMPSELSLEDSRFACVTFISFSADCRRSQSRYATRVLFSCSSRSRRAAM